MNTTSQPGREPGQERAHQEAQQPPSPQSAASARGSAPPRLDDERPWGGFSVLADEDDHKVKRLVVLPGTRLSLQRHRLRSEHWHVVAGTALVTIDMRELTLGPGGSADIPRGTAHRVANVGSDLLLLIEVQRGDYFGEDDIERLEDDFGRA